MAEQKREEDEIGIGEFPTTKWSLVVVLQSDDSKGKSRALEVICQDYWQPLFRQAKSWTRRNGDHPTLGPEDLIQSFFLNLSKKRILDVADQDRGRLRSLLSIAFRNFCQNERVKAATQRRGGDHSRADLKIDELKSDERETPEHLFDRHWAENIMELAGRQLEQYYNLRNRSGIFSHLWPLIDHEGQSPAFDEAAKALGTDKKRVAVELYRMRQRYRQNLLDQVARTVGSEDEVHEEFEYLKQLVTRSAS